MKRKGNRNAAELREVIAMLWAKGVQRQKPKDEILQLIDKNVFRAIDYMEHINQRERYALQEVHTACLSMAYTHMKMEYRYNGQKIERIEVVTILEDFQPWFLEERKVWMQSGKPFDEWTKHANHQQEPV